MTSIPFLLFAHRSSGDLLFSASPHNESLTELLHLNSKASLYRKGITHVSFSFFRLLLGSSSLIPLFLRCLPTIPLLFKCSRNFKDFVFFLLYVGNKESGKKIKPMRIPQIFLLSCPTQRYEVWANRQDKKEIPTIEMNILVLLRHDMLLALIFTKKRTTRIFSQW